MKVHIIDNTDTLLKAIEKPLRDMKVKIFSTGDPDSTIDDVKAQAPDAILINIGKKNFDSADLCRKIRKVKIAKYLYIIIITDRENQKDAIKAVNAGADDFIFKPFGRHDLEMRFKLAQRIAKLEEKLSKYSKSLIKLAKEDPHTGLLNRRSLFDEALKEMRRASRDRKYMAAIMATINNFKETVDNFGAETGDAVLIEFANRLKSSCRPYDLFGRYGISEFLVLLPNTDIKNSEKPANRILSSVTEKPFIVKGRELNVTISIGISELDPENIATSKNVDDHLLNDLLLDSLVRRTEIAMDEARKKGGNKIEIYSLF